MTRSFLALIVFVTLVAFGTTTLAQVPFGIPGEVRPDVPAGAKLPSVDQGAATSAATSKPKAQPKKKPTGAPSATGEPEEELEPFGANLFMGNFLRAREDGLNPEYVIAPGDQVAVHSWGAAEVSGVFVVDGQGNVFLPGIGPVRLAGVRNAELTQRVRQGLERVYRRNFDVYTNLITAKPVAVFVTGGVSRPGRYAGTPSDSVLFFLDQAGGIDPKLGSYRSISLLREGKPIAELDLYDFILNGKLETPQFKEGDTILVRRRGSVVELRGDVAAPSLIEFASQDPTGNDALEVIPGAARATEVTVTGLRGGTPFSHTLSLRGFAGFRLRHGDTITLRDDGRAEAIFIRLEGEFLGPSLITVRRGARLVDVLNHIAIPEGRANTRAVHIKRASVARAQKDAIDDALFRLERSALLALSMSRGGSEIRVKEADLTQRFVERARLIQPLGRVVTSRDGRQLNMVLEEGDIIVIPPRMNVVRVGGEVMMNQAVVYGRNLTAGDYIAMAGGYTERADEGRVIVLHADASVTTGGDGMEIMPGDEILVPPTVDSKWLPGLADVTQIIYQVAVATGVIVLLGK
jgi:protein involved in polysaccharide export with SLBB domain